MLVGVVLLFCPIDPGSAARYLSQNFGDDLDSVKGAMETFAKANLPEIQHFGSYSTHLDCQFPSDGADFRYVA